jgi:hypothetical protein
VTAVAWQAPITREPKCTKLLHQDDQYATAINDSARLLPLLISRRTPVFVGEFVRGSCGQLW